MLQVAGPVVVTVMKIGPEFLKNVIASPSGSEPITVWSWVSPSLTVMSATGLTTGGRPHELHTVMVNGFESVRLPSLTRTVALYAPASVKPGARWMLPVAVPIPALVVVTVMKVGPETFAKSRAFPSGSWPVIPWSWVEFSARNRFGMGSRIGGQFDAVIVIVNERSALSLPSLARTVAPYVPSGSAAPGAKWMFPVVGDVVVTVMNVGPAAFEKVSASPSGSEPVTV